MTGPAGGPPDLVDDDVPTIGDDMLHPDLDFEAGMGVVPAVALALIVACVLVFAAEVVRGALTDPKEMLRLGALSAAEVRGGGAWRLVSAWFLHAGVDHLIGNMVVLYVLGIACEHAFGRLQFVTLYVGAGLAGSAFSLAGGRTSVGASGAIFGLIGAAAVTLWVNRKRLHLRDRRISGVLAAWAGYQFLLGFLSPEVDNLAHLGGFLGGAVLGLILPSAVVNGRQELARRPAVLAGFAAACLTLAAASVRFVPRMFG